LYYKPQFSYKLLAKCLVLLRGVIAISFFVFSFARLLLLFDVELLHIII